MHGPEAASELELHARVAIDRGVHVVHLIRVLKVQPQRDRAVLALVAPSRTCMGTRSETSVLGRASERLQSGCSSALAP